MLLKPLSATEDAFRDTVVGKTAGSALRVLSDFYRIPYPAAISEDAWRAAMLEVVFGPRGTAGATIRFLRAALSDFDTELVVSVNPVNPRRLTAQWPYAFNQEHVGRWVEVRELGEDSRRLVGNVYKVAGPDTVGAGSYVELVPTVNAPYWSGAAFQEPAQYTALILPFRVEEATEGLGAGGYNNLVKVVLYDDLAFAPPTYLQDDAGARPPNQPWGGQLQEDEFEPSSQEEGPYPPYLLGAAFPEIQKVLEVLLASGIEVLFVNYQSE